MINGKDLDEYTKADLLIRIAELEKKLTEFEEKNNKFNSRILSAMSELTNYVAKWKHPVSRLVVIFSVILSTVINQLPAIITLFQ